MTSASQIKTVGFIKLTPTWEAMMRLFYSGSGPAQLAYALLRDAVGPNAARSLYGAFKDDKVARWDRSMVWTITSAEVQAWAKSRLHIESR